jgi:N6-adenosine-specific RNA methylase IME4
MQVSAMQITVSDSGYKIPGFYALKTRERDEVLELAQKLGPVDVIAADFPWAFRTHSKKGKSRAADRHYSVMTLEEIESYPVKSFAAQDCVFLMWATVPFLECAITAMRSQGFDYKSSAAWNKEIVGTGYWFRNQHEVLLLGTRGHPKPPLPGDRSASVIIERRTTHSTKPDAAYQLIERAFPDRKRLELFARPPGRPEWWSVGLDTTAEAAAFRAELRDLNHPTAGPAHRGAVDAQTAEKLP